MRKFVVNVNGASYEIEVEEVTGITAAAKPAPAPASAPAAPKTEQPKASAPAAEPKDGQEISYSPMPGTIIDIKVSVGDMVQAGQTVMVLEAMKMENELMPEKAGKVVSIDVTKGATVNAGDKLFVIE